MIVSKFGGSSLVDIVALNNIKKISKNKNRKILIFSAMGKPNFADKKLTDILINKDFFNAKKYLKYLCNICKVNININKYINNINKIYTNNKDDEWLVSRGEYLTCLIISKYLNIKFIPAENIIYLDNNNFNYKKINNKINYYLKKYNQIIIPGFYGIDQNKKIKIFSRGGGDITGALVAKISNAKVFEKFTDTCGIKMANPAIIKNAKQILAMSYDDAKIMTDCDASVLHKDVCSLLSSTNVETLVKSTFDTKSKPTHINNKNHKCQFVCYKQNLDYVQIVAKVKCLDSIKKYFDIINYLNQNYVFLCSDKTNYQKVIKGVYKALEKKI